MVNLDVTLCSLLAGGISHCPRGLSSCCLHLRMQYGYTANEQTDLSLALGLILHRRNGSGGRDQALGCRMSSPLIRTVRPGFFCIKSSFKIP